MKIKSFMKHFKKGVLKYFKIFMNFFLIFESEIFHRAALVTMHARDWTEQARTLQ